RGTPPDHGELVLWILNPDGTQRMEQRIPRAFCNILSFPDGPLCNAVHVSPDGDWVLFNVWTCHDSDEHSGAWVFRLSDGAFVGRRPWSDFRDASGESFTSLQTMAVVRGTGLLIAEGRTVGARSALLLDPLDGIVWSHTMPAAIFRRERAADFPFTLGSDAEGEFAALDVEKQERVVYSVVRTGEGVTVAEKARSAWQAPMPASAESLQRPMVELEPELLGRIHLSSADEASAHAVPDFTFDEAGNLIWPQVAGEVATVLRSTPGGELLADVPITQSASLPSKLVHLGGDRLALIGGRGEAGTQLAVLDLASGTLSPSQTIDCTRVLSLSAFSNGDLLLLTSKHHRYTITETLARRTPAGDVVWSKETGGYRVPEDFWQAAAATVLAEDEVAVLRTTSRDVQIFGPDGAFRRLVNLTEGWGRAPNYPTDIARAPEGGFLIRDFNGPAAVVECDAQGRTRREFTPQSADGYTFDGTLRFAPNGDLWATNRSTLLRLDAGGRESARIGEPPTDSRINAIGRIAITRDGIIHAIDERTRNVFVYDDTGALLRRCVPNAGDFGPTERRLRIAFTPDGGFVLSPDFGGRSASISFSATGERLGPFEPGNREAAGIVFQPAGARRWSPQYRSIRLEDMAGQLVREIERDSRGHWIDGAMYPVVAPDGSLAVEATRGRTTMIFAADGTPIASLSARGLASMMDFDGTWIARSEGGAVLLTRADASRCLILKLPAAADKYPRPFLLPARGELWIWNAPTPTIDRYRLPE
ncbi:MAG: hypothetical protein KF858_15460, partial [Candidatus Sumerlaeia bacterium]|nr:hypothetical protein [Candidatus Sumerlaeia bacterium]